MSNGDVEIIKTIDRLLRAQPRNRDVILVCGELHARISANRAPADAPRADVPGGEGGGGKFDKKGYQRELMRKRRAEGKA